MKFNKLILVSAFISTLSLSALAESTVDQNKPMSMSPMAQGSALTTGDGAGNMPEGMPMNMKMGQHASGTDSQQAMMQGGMGMSMMKMMPEKMAEMKQHREQVEMHLANIESSLQQLVELQKAK